MPVLRAAAIAALSIIILVCSAILILRRGDIPYETLRERYGAERSAFVETPEGLKVHYRDEGAASDRVLVLLHGYGSSTATWDPWIARLAPHYRLVALDLPGHGLTEAPADARATPKLMQDAIEAVRTQIGADRFVLVGHSMGAAIAAAYAWERPQALQALILVSPASFRTAAAADQPFSAMLRSPIGPILRDLDATAMLRAAMASGFVDQGYVTEDRVRRVAELARGPGHRALLAQMLSRPEALPQLTEQDLAGIGVPTLILQGAADAIVPPTDARRHKELIPDSRFVLFFGAGHFPQEEAADRSADAVVAFLQAKLEPPALSGAPLLSLSP